MKRYTFNSGDGYWAISGKECFDDQDENYSGPAIDKLAEYENLEEASRLVILPCKIGDTVYQPSYRFTACSAYNYIPKYKHDLDCEGCCCECDSEHFPYVYEGRVCKLEVISNGAVKVYVQFKDKWDASGYNIGRELFLTREEAEEKLKDK
jgi:hypothetical protein